MPEIISYYDVIINFLVPVNSHVLLEGDNNNILVYANNETCDFVDHCYLKGHADLIQ